MEELPISIALDEEVWNALKAEAEPLVDTPNTVLRRKFGLDATGPEVAIQDSDTRNAATPDRPKSRRSGRRVSSNSKPGARKRAPRGSLLPEEAYELPILQALHNHGGRAAAREVIDEVGDRVRDQLTALDQEDLATGGLRWQKRVQFTRIRLVERGLVKKHSPRGVWEITDEGRRAITAGSTSV